MTHHTVEPEDHDAGERDDKELAGLKAELPDEAMTVYDGELTELELEAAVLAELAAELPDEAMTAYDEELTELELEAAVLAELEGALLTEAMTAYEEELAEQAGALLAEAVAAYDKVAELDGELPAPAIMLGSAVEAEQHDTIASNPRIQGPHSISRQKFIETLAALRSPAASEAATLAEIPGRYGIDRGIALAFFVHESSAGRAGIVRDYGTRNWGNLRRLQRPERGEQVQTRRGQFARYVSWAAGLEDWCELILNVYVGRWRLVTLGEVLKKYAPKADQNDPEAYARKVVRHIRSWQGEMKQTRARLAPEAPAQSGRAPWYVTVTATAGLNIRQGRGTDFPLAGKLAFGERVLVGDARAGWLWLNDGRGFIAQAFTEER